MDGKILLNKLGHRYAVKRFDSSKKIPAEIWNQLEESLVLTPSSYGLQPWRFVVVTDSETRKELRKHSWNQSQIEDCSHLVVFMAKESVSEADIDHYIDRIVEIRQVPRSSLDEYRSMMIGDLVKGERSRMIDQWASKQAYIALGNLLTSAALLDIDACPMEGIDPVQYDRLLKIEGYKTRVVAAVGYRSDQDVFANFKKVRFPREEIVHRR